MTTPTPRTDAKTVSVVINGPDPDSHNTVTVNPTKYGAGRYVEADFARQLERELAEARASVENYASAAEELRQEVNELHNRSRAELAQRDALIQRILDYPYLPQNLATIIRKELENV